MAAHLELSRGTQGRMEKSWHTLILNLSCRSKSKKNIFRRGQLLLGWWRYPPRFNSLRDPLLQTKKSLLLYIIGWELVIFVDHMVRNKSCRDLNFIDVLVNHSTSDIMFIYYYSKRILEMLCLLRSTWIVYYPC